jgi:hypothetical protein
MVFFTPPPPRTTPPQPGAGTRQARKQEERIPELALLLQENEREYPPYQRARGCSKIRWRRPSGGGFFAVHSIGGFLNGSVSINFPDTDVVCDKIPFKERSSTCKMGPI